VRFTSPSRRAAGLLAVTTIGLSTAVLSVTGVASAAPVVITSDDQYSASTDDGDAGITIDPGYCYGIFDAIGGQGGESVLGAEDGGLGGLGEVWASVTAGESYTFQSGAAGAAGPAGAGGTNAARAADNGIAGTGLGGGGGAGSVILLGSARIVGGAGGTGAGTGGGAGGGANYFDPARDDQDRGYAGVSDGGWTGDGYAAVGVVGCDAPEAPSIGAVSAEDGSATVAFYPVARETTTAAASSYDYSLDGGTTWTPVSAPTATGGDFGELAFTIPALTNDQTYTVVMRSQSTYNGTSGTGEASDSFTPHHYIDGPATAELTGGPSSVTFSWTPPADTTDLAGYAMAAYPQGYDGDPEAPGAPAMASCDAPAGATSCVVAATPGFAYAGYVTTVDSAGYYGSDTDAGTTAVILAPAAPSDLPKADGPLATSDADGAVTAGQQITLSGDGYLPGSTVELSIYSTPISLGQAIVGADGRFTVTVTLPASLTNGTHHLVATGVDANGNVRYLVVEVTVSGGVVTGLAYTGFSALPYAGAGALALLIGAGLLVASRRRQAA
jgi:hypothetical protein